MKKDKMRRMTTAQLDELLQAELRKDTPDDEVVLPILEILEKRDRKPRRKHNWIITMAATAAVVVLMITVAPRAVGADSLWEAVTYISDGILQFFAPGKEPRTAESKYTFQTDNAGLQQLYDKVIELGIADPVVPMWLPEGYELAEIKNSRLEGWEKIAAIYKKNEQAVLITYKISVEISSTQYEIRQSQVEVYETGDIKHAISKNGEKCTAVWVRNGVECVISADIRDEELRKVIASIYRRDSI